MFKRIRSVIGQEIKYYRLLRNSKSLDFVYVGRGVQYTCDTIHMMSLEISNIDKPKVIIGCRQNTIEGWDKFFSRNCHRQFQTSRRSFKFKLIKQEYLLLKQHYNL